MASTSFFFFFNDVQASSVLRLVPSMLSIAGWLTKALATPAGGMITDG